jgi:FlaA1/EpsC-like NDP-sugar epimerase
MVYGSLLAEHGSAQGFWNDYTRKTLVIAILGPFALYDRQLKLAGGSVRLSVLLRRVTLCFLRFSGIVLALGYATRSTDILPRSLLAMWLGTGFALTLTSRVLLVEHIRLLERSGILTEAVAIVGAGEVADRLIHQLLQSSRPASIDIVGVFDDRESCDEGDAARGTGGRFRSTGTIADLIKLGKTRHIDWMLLTLPCTAERRLRSIVHSLKTLAAPVALCPQNVGLSLPYRLIRYVGDGIPVTLLADRPIHSWNAVFKKAADVIGGGLITLLLSPLMALAIRLDSPGPMLFRQRRHRAGRWPWT